MAYFKPYIDETGLHINSYVDIRDYLIEQARSIFGQDIYLEIDSQDYEMLSVEARMAYAHELVAQDNYNARSPRTSFGNTLDGIITINGIERLPATRSTVTLTLTGTQYAVITNGVVSDLEGNLWNLPSQVIIPAGGTIQVSAIAQEYGAIIAQANTITNIVTPTWGWNTVTNEEAASPGQPVETDAELKARREVSIATPGQTPLETYTAGLWAVPGVTDVKVYENDTKQPDKNYAGEPANSVTSIVEGGLNEDIGNALAKRKNMGVRAYGDVIVSVINEYGSPQDYGFFRPAYQQVFFNIQLKPLDGYTTEVAADIEQQVKDYLLELTIGNNLYVSQIWEAALKASPDKVPYFAIRDVTQGTSSGSLSTADIIALFNGKFTFGGLTITTVA